ncbi:Gfo/Idh/MocA family oxidoreductase [Lachnobacterium bovis]|uniref:Gfo/Idh/MocA family oxidoreductase n=1 Tax=Lachnobacterium bovis TaxID=140626 RepID=UPI0003B3E7D8|nr:Gfo/Idh/MocA family oxidoreductase [Lachnobacterium bovis]
MINIGIIGAGNMGKNHIRLTKEMHDRFNLCAVYDPNRERLQELEVEDIAVESEDELIDKCDAVIIAAPSSLHKELALKVAKAGKHLLVEKPLALSCEDAKEIVRAFEASKKILMVGHVERFNGAVTELEEVLKDEEIIAVNIERCSSMDTRIKDTDVVYDLMIHDVDILLNAILPGKKLKRIISFGTKSYSENYMDYVESLMEFEGGVIASIISSRTTEDKLRRIDIHCKKSFIKVDLLNKRISILRRTRLESTSKFTAVYKKENITEKIFVPNVEPLREELKDFQRSIENDKAVKTSGKSALRSVEILDIIKKDIY